MPGWNIHLEAGERIIAKLKLSGKKRRAFLLGCLLPDINNGYINHVKVEKPHGETHYAFNQKSSLNFYAENQAKIDVMDPLYLGCLLHLYTDGYFNYNFYHYVKRSPIGKNLDHLAKREIKHHDFRIYDANFHHHLGLIDPAETRELARLASQISVIEITADDIMDVERILCDKTLAAAVEGQSYIFYSEPKLDKLLSDMIKSFSQTYLGEENA